MKLNLDTLATEIQTYLEAEGFSVFFGHSRVVDSESVVIWNTTRHPDYKPFLQSAKAAGERLVVLNQRDFSADAIDDAIDQMEVSEMPIEEQRSIDRRLKELRVYEGFTCALEISFDHNGRTYLFEVETEWYEEFSNLIDDLDFLNRGDDDDDEEADDGSSISGYFSKN